MGKYIVKLIETIWITRVITAESENRAQEIMMQAWEEGKLDTYDGDVNLISRPLTPKEDGVFIEYEEGE